MELTGNALMGTIILMISSLILLCGDSASAQGRLCNARLWPSATDRSVQASMQAGDNPTARCSNSGESDYPIHLAAILANDAGAVQALVDAGASPLTRNAAGETAVSLFEARYEQAVLSFGRPSSALTAMARIFNVEFETAGTAQNNLCSLEWLASATGSSMESVVETQGVNLSPDCGGGNTPLHVALGMSGILSEDNAFAIGTLIDAGVSLSVVNSRGQTPLDLAENRYQRTLIRWDRDAVRLCHGVDRTDQEVQREVWELEIYYYMRESSGRESREQVRARVSGRLSQAPNCPG